MEAHSIQELEAQLQGILDLQGRPARVADASALRSRGAEALARAAALSPDEPTRNRARALALQAAAAAGIYPASIQELYAARGRGQVRPFTAAAMNLRCLTFDVAAACFRAARKLEVGAFLFEIARSEMAYTFQRPAEYTASLLCAALKEGWQGPVFIQGDHFQANSKKYAANPDAEIQEVKKLATEAIAAGFYNIDVDTSTLVDLSQPTVPEQQRVNGERCAEITAHVRAMEPPGTTISVGGEIGEVGGHNSNETELRAFMGEYRTALRRYGQLAGISKISIQTGTSHGGVPLPDGSVAQVKLDFDTLGRLSRLAREEFGLGGAVQHGASTLPAEVFNRFPELETVEIHLATEFQNMVYDHPAFPAALRAEMYQWLRQNAADERKAGDTDEQFYYKSRKKALGPFKGPMWNLPPATREAIAAALQAKFEYLFGKLALPGTAPLVARHVTRPQAEPRAQAALAQAGRAEESLEGE
ncbi:MAG TPA: class II fructose-bisphosphate aldolase [Candidatus Saccharimonadales bacterium]|nr:class II fructose-bisphosphate aldolase [Candidatus Saccharimonadales bacterium]